MELVRGVVRWLRVIIKFPASLHLFRHYGPDLATLASRNSAEDAVREIIKRYTDEVFYLLPRRYELIVQKICEEGHITEQEFEEYRQSSQSIVLGGGKTYLVTMEEEAVDSIELVRYTEPPWVTDPDILERLSVPLQEKIQSFEKDRRIASKCWQDFPFLLSY